MAIEFKYEAEAAGFLQTTEKVKQELMAARDLAAQTKKELSGMFAGSARDNTAYQQEIQKTLKIQMEQKAVIDQLIKKITELESAEKKTGNSAGTQEQIDKIKELSAEIDRLKAKMKAGNASPVDKGAINVMTSYAAAISAAKDELAKLQEGSSEYKKVAAEIEAAETAVKKLTISVDENGDATGGSRAELKAMREALIELKKAGLDQTEVYKNLKEEAGELADTIADVNEEFKASGSDTAGLDRLVRGITLVTNAMGILEGLSALAGDENKELQETLVRLNAIMLITNSLQQVMEELKRRDNVVTAAQIALQKAYAVVVGETTGALKVLRVAMASTGIGLLIIAITALVLRMKQLKDEADALAQSQKLINDINGKATEGYVKQSVELEILRKRATQVNLTQKEQESIMKDYNKTFGDSIGKAKDFKDAQDKIINLGPEYIQTLTSWANAQAAFAAAVELSKEAILTQLKSAADFGGALDFLNISDASRAAADEENKKRRAEAVAALQADAKKAINIGLTYQDDVEHRQRQHYFNLEKQDKDHTKKTEDEAKKRAERLIKLQRDLAQARIDALSDGLAKERAAEANEYNNKIDDLIAQRLELEKDGLKKNLVEIQKINALIDAETTAHLARDLAITTKYFEDSQKAYKDAGDAINDTLLTEQDKELNQTEKHYDELLDKIKEAKKKAAEYNQNTNTGQFDLTTFDADAEKLEEERQKKRNEIILKYALQRLETEKEMQLSTIAAIRIGGVSEEKETEIKEAMKLEVERKYAKLRIQEALKEQLQKGLITKEDIERLTDPATLLAAQEQNMDIFTFLGIKIDNKEAKKIVADALAGVTAQAPKVSKEFNLFRSLGIDEESEKKLKGTLNGLKEFGGAFSQAFGEIAGLYDQQIEKRQQNIEAMQQEIDQQEDKVAKEKDLQDEGYANNYDLEQQKLIDLKERQDKEKELMDEAQKKKQAIQKAQLIADSISQLSSLVTAAAEIFAATASIPVVGVGLAIAAIAAMFIGFAAAKVSAWNAINNQKQSLGDGGYVGDGRSHGDGGNKYRSVDGNDIVEIEKGEFVTNKRATRKYRPVLEAINSDTLDGMTRFDLARMLRPMNISLSDESLPEKVSASADGRASTVVITTGSDADQWDKQNKILTEIKNKTDGPKVEYVNGYKIERWGNRVRKTKLK